MKFGFNTALPIEEAITPPSAWYTEAEIARLELQTVFRRTWQPVGRVSQVQAPGDYFSGELAGEPFVVSHAEDGRIRAFYNVCRHHAAIVADGEGCAREFVCPYHGWTYRLDGRLRSAPRLGAVKYFNREDYGLVEIDLDRWGPFLWLRLDRSGPSLADWCKPLARFLSPGDLESLKFVTRRTYEIECNWKVYVDNYLDGGYHVEVAHKDLASQLDLDDYEIVVDGRAVFQTCKSGGGSERLGGGAVYAWIYPNFMINRYGPIMDTNWVLPLGPDRCLTVFDYYYADVSDTAFIERSLKDSHQVQLEDVQICESVQKGLRSSGYDVGRYAPQLEIGEYLFHQWLADELGLRAG